MFHLLYKKLHDSTLGYLMRRWYRQYQGPRDLQRYDDYTYLCKLYRELGRELDVANPLRFTEKLQWLKLFWRDDQARRVTDKYEVREYLTEHGHADLLNELIAVYDTDDIDIKSLPKQFVLKATHGSGWNLIVKDKSQVNWLLWKAIIRSMLKQNYYYFGREWNYDGLKPRIVIEKYLQDDSGELRDYKIFCFNGEPLYIQLDENRFTNHKRIYVDCQGNVLDMSDSLTSNEMLRFSFKAEQHKMIELARELSKPFPEVRMDFYECNGKILFGEFTFFDGGGMYSFTPDEWDFHWGEKLQLPEPNHNLELYKNLLSSCKKG